MNDPMVLITATMKKRKMALLWAVLVMLSLADLAILSAAGRDVPGFISDNHLGITNAQKDGFAESKGIGAVGSTFRPIWRPPCASKAARKSWDATKDKRLC